MKSEKKKPEQPKRELTAEEWTAIIDTSPLFQKMNKQAEERLRKSPPPEWMLP